MLERLDHVIIAVNDLPGAVAAFSTLLDDEPSVDQASDVDVARARFQLLNTSVELMAPATADSVSEARGPFTSAAWLSDRLAVHGEGPAGLAFAAADLEASRVTLKSRGYETFELDRSSASPPRLLVSAEATRGVGLFVVQSTLASFEPAATSTGLDHAVVRTLSPESARSLYGDGLGLRMALDREFPDWGVRLQFFRVGGLTLEVAAALDAAEKEPAGLGTTTATHARDELWGLSWRVPEAEAARARLLTAGLEVSPVRSGRKPGTRVFTVKSGALGIPTLMISPEPA